MKKLSLLKNGLSYFNHKAGITPKLATLAATLSFTTATAAPPTCSNYGNGQPQNIVYSVNGSTFTTLAGNVSSGAVVNVYFDLSSGSDTTMFSLVAYKAPGSTFNNATAPLQTIFDTDTKTFYGAGTHSLSVTIPGCYFQVDFVKGCPIAQFGANGPNDFYGAQGRLIDADNGGSGTCNCVAQADAGADFAMSCGAATVNLQGSTWVHNPVISWQVAAGGTITGGSNMLTPTINGPGIYVLSITDSLNCTATSTVTVTGGGSLSINLGNDTSIVSCSHPSLMLNAGVAGGIYVWSTGDTTQNITVTATGIYTVGVTDNMGCTATDAISVTVQDNSVNVNLGRDTTVCGCIVLSAGYPNGSHYWCSGESYPAISVCHSGVYCVSVSNGMCMGYDTIHVTINPLPVVFLGNDTTAISGTLVLDAGNAGASYLWSTGAITQTIAVSGSGTYYVAVTNGSGCTVTDTIHLGVVQGLAHHKADLLPLQVFPNPAEDKQFELSFHADQGDMTEVKIYSQMGEVVYAESLPHFSGTYNKVITLDHCAPGMYFATVLSNNKKKVVKIALN